MNAVREAAHPSAGSHAEARPSRARIMQKLERTSRRMVPVACWLPA